MSLRARRSSFVKKCDVIARRAKPDAATPRWTSQAIKRLVDRQHPVAGPAGALRASKFAPGEFVVAALLAMTSLFLTTLLRCRDQSGRRLKVNDGQFDHPRINGIDDNGIDGVTAGQIEDHGRRNRRCFSSQRDRQFHHTLRGAGETRIR